MPFRFLGATLYYSEGSLFRKLKWFANPNTMALKALQVNVTKGFFPLLILGLTNVRNDGPPFNFKINEPSENGHSE